MFSQVLADGWLRVHPCANFCNGFATQDPSTTFLAGLAASLGLDLDGFTEAPDDGQLGAALP